MSGSVTCKPKNLKMSNKFHFSLIKFIYILIKNNGGLKWMQRVNAL